MPIFPMINHSMPETVGDLAGFTVEIRCPSVRVAEIDPKKMASGGGRALDHRMPLPQFLARPKCTKSACGAKPDTLHLKSRTPAGFGTRPSPWRHWTMDRRGD
jgi:hypothetical protein